MKRRPPNFRPGWENWKECRRCGYHNETLPHVLCSCEPHFASNITPRHNAIQNRIVNAIQNRHKGRTVEVNKTIRFLAGGRPVRPDIVVHDPDKNLVTILDVSCPFENGQYAFDRARARKIAKYAPEVATLESYGYTVHFDAILVGPLGTWDRFNDAILLQLGVTRSFLAKMKRIVCQETVERSKDIYWRHIFGLD